MIKLLDEQQTDIYILKDALREIREGLHRAANGGLKDPGHREKIGDFKKAARRYRNIADGALSRTKE